MIWRLSHRAERLTREIADRHYNRQHVGAPGFVPPGRCMVLVTEAADAFWVTSWPFAEYVRHAWPGAWICSAFRREPHCPYRASDMIRAAVAATRWYWPEMVPRIPATIIGKRKRKTAAEVSMVTFVDRDRVLRKRDYGRCYRRAGFEEIGDTKGGLLALGLRFENLPAAAEPEWRLIA